MVKSKHNYHKWNIHFTINALGIMFVIVGFLGVYFSAKYSNITNMTIFNLLWAFGILVVFASSMVYLKKHKKK